MIGTVLLALACNPVDKAACQAALDKARKTASTSYDPTVSNDVKTACGNHRAAEQRELDKQLGETLARLRKERKQREESELAPFREFLAWTAEVAKDPKTKFPERECYKRPDPQAGFCEALTHTGEGKNQRSFWSKWWEKDPAAVHFSFSGAPTRSVSCAALGQKAQRVYRYASARKEQCNYGTKRVVIEQYAGGAFDTTKIMVFSSEYLAKDPEFAATLHEGRDVQ